MEMENFMQSHLTKEGVELLEMQTSVVTRRVN